MFPLRAEGLDEPSKSIRVGTGKWADWAGSSFWEEGGKVKALGAEWWGQMWQGHEAGLGAGLCPEATEGV